MYQPVTLTRQPETAFLHKELHPLSIAFREQPGDFVSAQARAHSAFREPGIDVAQPPPNRAGWRDEGSFCTLSHAHCSTARPRTRTAVRGGREKITAPLMTGADPGCMRLLRQAADARVADSRAERAASRGTVTDHLVAPALFPAMPPEVIRWDIRTTTWLVRHFSCGVRGPFCEAVAGGFAVAGVSLGR
jgi:hypothetical protein